MNDAEPTAIEEFIKIYLQSIDAKLAKIIDLLYAQQWYRYMDQPQPHLPVWCPYCQRYDCGQTHILYTTKPDQPL